MINALSSSLAYLNCALKERSRPRRLRHSYVKTVLLPLLLAAAPALNALLSLLYAPLQLHLQGELRSLGSAISRDIVTENPNVKACMSSSWPEPASPPAALDFGMLPKQYLLPGLSILVTWGAAGKVWEQVLVLIFPAWPPQAPGTSPVDTSFIKIPLWMPLLSLGPGGGLVRGR
eukprot:1149254-Pelagomonas_calceolata.AAC.1